MNKYPTLVLTLVVALSGSFAISALEPATWQESAQAAGAVVQEAEVGSMPLVTDGATYDVQARIIHDQKERIEYPVQFSEREWKQMLDQNEYNIIRKADTERPFTGELNDNKQRGVYYSLATGQPLFRSEDKFDSGTGWPSFTKPITPDAIVYVNDSSLFSRRVEVVDSLSGAHLGHVFNDGPDPTGQRYCINSASLVFVPYDGDPPELLLPE